ncbi:hypothetical protein EYF80_025491 [Liparis tanakae]|uniref:Uncharacterized protein n=1 Tax=Liparis tanakae TaxID=230148 RepID=A0A4Z2HFB8_9TELE|nr:hypothetical protein EYF80_025491 [Liparis tanakae]
MFKCTDQHPDGEAAPRPPVQLHHEVDVDENAEQGQPGEERDLEEWSTWGKMMTRQTMQSRVRITHGNTTTTWPASSCVRQLARITHSTVMKRAAERREGDNSKSSFTVKVSRRGLASVSVPYSSPLSPPPTATFSPSTSSTSFSVWLDELRVPGWYLRRDRRVSEGGMHGETRSTGRMQTFIKWTVALKQKHTVHSV